MSVATLYIMDNQRVSMTPQEWELYQKIVKSYTTANNKGEHLFAGLFVANSDGIITSLIPPSKRHTSFEVFFFLMSLMQNQHLRLLHEQVADVCNQMKNKMKELESKTK